MKSLKKTMEAIGLVKVPATVDHEYNTLYSEYQHCNDAMLEFGRNAARLHVHWDDVVKNAIQALKAARKGLCEAGNPNMITVASSMGSGLDEGASETAGSEGAAERRVSYDMLAPVKDKELANSLDKRIEDFERFKKGQINRISNPEHVDSPMVRPFQDIQDAVKACKEVKGYCTTREKKRSDFDAKRDELNSFEEKLRKDVKKDLEKDSKEYKTDAKSLVKEDKKREKDEKKKAGDASKLDKLRQETSQAGAAYNEANETAKRELIAITESSRIKLKKLYEVYFQVFSSTTQGLQEL